MPTREQREKQEAKRQRRFERRAERGRQSTRDRRRRLLRMAGFGMAGLAVVAALVWFVYLQPRPGESVSTSGAGDHSGAPPGGYSTSPPTSGPHSPQAPAWGDQDGLSEVLQVHALEHGGVLVQYNCPQGCPQLVRLLQIITSDYDRGVILAPYSMMDARIALTSWGRIDLLDEFDSERIEEFVSKNRGRGPEAIQ